MFILKFVTFIISLLSIIKTNFIIIKYFSKMLSFSFSGISFTKASKYVFLVSAQQ